MKRGEFLIRDTRNKQHYLVDDEYLNGHAKVCGIFATGVYNALCRHADFHTQTTFPSVELMATKLAISRHSVHKGLALLEKYNIISRERVRNPKTGRWKHNSYVLIDKSQWLPCAPQRHGEPCAPQRHGDRIDHASVRGTKDSHVFKDSHIGETEVSQDFSLPIVEEVETSRKEKKKPKYPNAPIVFSWFPDPQLSWKANSTELEHAELLFLRGEQKVRNALAYCEEHKNDERFYTVTKPSDLERKWLDLRAHREKHL